MTAVASTSISELSKLSRFGASLRSEATKLRSVRRWLIALVAFVLLTVGFGILSAAGSGSDANEHPAFVVGPRGTAVADEMYFVHGPLHGDGAVIARVASQTRSHPWARAGLTIKQGTNAGARYASIWVSPAHGVHFDTDFRASKAGSGGRAPRWL